MEKNISPKSKFEFYHELIKLISKTFLTIVKVGFFVGLLIVFMYFEQIGYAPAGSIESISSLIVVCALFGTYLIVLMTFAFVFAPFS